MDIQKQKQEWNAPSVEILSTRRTAAGGAGVPDVFHTAMSATNSLPSFTIQPS